MASKLADWRDPAREKIISLFTDNLEVLSPVLLYLDLNEDCQSWRTVDLLLSNETGFKAYVEGLAKSVKDGRKNGELQIAGTSNVTVNLIYGFGFAGLARAWGKLPSSIQDQILSLTNNNWLLGKLSACVNKLGGNNVMAMWSAVYFGYQTVQNIDKWKKGDLSGSQCVNNIVDSSVKTAAGIGGAAIGATIGAVAGPLGSLAGGFIGGLIFSSIAKSSVDVSALFDGPKEEARMKAFESLGAKCGDTLESVKDKFLSLIKNCDSKQITCLQMMMALCELK